MTKAVDLSRVLVLLLRVLFPSVHLQLSLLLLLLLLLVVQLAPGPERMTATRTRTQIWLHCYQSPHQLVLVLVGSPQELRSGERLSKPRPVPCGLHGRWKRPQPGLRQLLGWSGRLQVPAAVHGRRRCRAHVPPPPFVAPDGRCDSARKSWLTLGASVPTARVYKSV